MRLFAPAFLLLAGCATATDLAQEAPDQVYRSAHSRQAVADCLLDRLSSPELRPVRTTGAEETTLAFESTGGLARPRPVLYLFRIRDDASGSVVEARRMRSLGRLELTTAETCF